MLHPRLAMALFTGFLVLSPLDAQEVPPMAVLKPEQLFTLVERLTEDVHYTVAGVERILGPIGLQKSDYVSRSFEVYEAQCNDSDWLKYVELRAPISGDPSTGRLLIVDLKEGVGKEIGYEQLFFHYGEEDEFRIPLAHAPAENPLSFGYSRDWGKLIFGITRDYEELVGIYIHVD